jgi:sialate O-acetylesterase
MKTDRFSHIGAAALGAALWASACGADVSLPGVFSDHMVLQREMRVPVWGQAAPGERVTVAFRNQRVTVTAGTNGAWQVHLKPLRAGGPDTLTVSGSNTVTLGDVLVGEVWVGSGQSNMQMPVRSYTNGDERLTAAAAAAPYPRLRLLTSRGNAVWQEATVTNVLNFSALLFSFGLPLQTALDVPVGLMAGAVGGTPSGYWLSQDALDADAACRDLIAKYAAEYDGLLKAYEASLPAWEQAVAAARAQGKPEPRRPDPPPKPGEAASGKVGQLYEAYIRPLIPFAMRGVLWDQGESGTALGGIDQYTLMGALLRGWRKDWGEGDFPFLYVQKRSGGGCAWDPSNPVTAKADAFRPLPAQVPNDGAYIENHIRIMRYPNTAMVISSDLGPGVHPVNKSGYGQRASDVALAVAYRKKVDYYGPIYAAHRVQGNAVRIRFAHTGDGLAFRHGEKLQGFAVAGPDRVYHWADARIVPSVFPWRKARAVVVSSPEVAQPVAVRYAWANQRPWANLFNANGLPAVPFRTDDW